MEQVKTRSRRSRDEMYAVMARYCVSGQTQATFCADEGLKVGTFQYWWRRYRGDEESVGGSGFVALAPQAAPGAEQGIELHFRAVRLELSGVRAGYVAELVHQLAGLC